MSEKKIRYFQAEDHVVARAMSSESQSRLAADPYYTEVQVVPVDAIVIRRDELPEVDTTDGARVNSAGIGWPFDYLTADRAEKARSYGLAYLALAEYLREHPPVDEAQVKALVALRDLWDSGDSDHNLWEFLVRHGVRVGAES